jgi:4-amino-4-deoxy-L-arabinose transferase-like glycosyltransferase
LIAPDAHSATFGVLTSYWFWRFLRNSDPVHALLAGLTLGLALLAKTTFSIFLFLWPLLWFMDLLIRGEWRNVRKSKMEFGTFILLLLCGVAVMHGIDLQPRDFENYATRSYLNGKFQAHGWWYFYLYVIAVMDQQIRAAYAVEMKKSDDS